MNINEYDFDLPEYLIAQTPLMDRTSSKLLVLDKKTGEVTHETFKNIVNYLKPNDVLVLNDTRVMPARLYGVKEDTQAKIEVLLLKQMDDHYWETLVKPARRVKVGTFVSFGEGKLRAECIEEKDEGIRIFKLHFTGILYEILDELGEMPLPPYILEKLEDQERYQTVYSKAVGSAAAPTAGLHFTNDLLEQIRSLGVSVAFVTLHVGLGTFRPVSVENVEEHEMHSEFYEMNAQTANLLNSAKEEGRRIISVGTTSTRTLETIMNLYGEFKECSGWTNIFIFPGYQFKAIDSLITNFHLPKSTLIMLISALAGRNQIMNAYQSAIEHEYRFFSFGDSMFIK